MKTIKVIDLLSHLSKYATNIKNKRMRYYDKNNDCYDECLLKEKEIIYRLYYGNIRLNDKVEIIEDTPKENRKIEYIETNYDFVFDEQVQQDSLRVIASKINEIIDKVNGDK